MQVKLRKEQVGRAVGRPTFRRVPRTDTLPSSCSTWIDGRSFFSKRGVYRISCTPSECHTNAKQPAMQH
jgi:hypothetical protein